MEYSGGGRREEEWKSGEDTDTTGMGRLYECVFCKRGFTTAQALGGHMNIHRKDRAKTNTTRPNTARASHEGAQRPQNDDVSYPPATHHHLHRCFMAAAAPRVRVPVDCGWSLSLQVGPSSRVDDHDRDDDEDYDDHDHGNVYNHDHDHDQDRRSFVGGEELDLELRLGHGRP